MGTRGRKPIPAVTKKLTGNPGKRPVREDPARIKLDELPPAPDFLGDIAKKEWERVGPYLVAMGLLTEADIMTFAAYCVNVEQMVCSIEEIKAEGYTIIGARGNTRNPALAAFSSAVSALRALATEFGMTPSSRGRMKTPGDDGETLDDLLEDGEEDIS